MNALCWAIVLCVKGRKLVSTDYTLPRTRAALIRTYGTFSDGGRLFSSAREATAELLVMWLVTVVVLCKPLGSGRYKHQRSQH